MNRRQSGFLIGILAFFLAACMAHAQENAVITGIVTDPSGAVVPQVTVTLTHMETGETRTTTTNSSGLYTFPSLHIGHYTLKAEASGFKTFTKTDIVLNVAQTLQENIPLALGTAGQTVTVQANALQVQSQTSEVSTLITGSQVTQLATNGRNVTALATLGMGVSNTMSDYSGVNALTSNPSISFNGTRPSHNVFMIDNGEIYDRGCGGCFSVLPSIDALAEFQTLDSNYSPDYGIGSGGTITMVLKSGTHDFHGGLWEFNRNEAYDANSYFLNRNGQSRPEHRLNLFGGNIGGPLWIPHVYNSDRKRTFFFVNEEWRRQIWGSAPTVTPTVPSSDFPAAGQSLVYVPPASSTIVPVVPKTSDPAKLALYAQDGLTPGQPFPNNTIPANLIDSNAVLFMNTGAIPRPNVAGVNNYISSIPQTTNVREDLVRIDHTINSKLQLMGHYIHDAMDQTLYPPLWSGGSYPTVGSVMQNPAWTAVIKLTQTLSSNMLNETAFNYDGNKIRLNPTGIYKQPTGWSAQSFFPAANNLLSRLPEVDFGAPYNTNWRPSYFPWKNAAEDYQVRDDFSWTKGVHSLKFGISYMRFIKNQQLQANTNGVYNFNSTAFSGDAYVDFLLGFATSFNQLEYMSTPHWVNNTYSFYANDNWHVNQRLTLNLGFRYDVLPHAYERYNRFANFVPADYDPTLAPEFNADGSLNPSGPGFSVPPGFNSSFYTNGIKLAGVNGFPRGNVRNYWGTIMPRIGFAADVFGDGKTVVRGGFGIFYERIQGNDVYNSALNPPFAFQPAANNVYFSNPHQSAITGATASTPYFPASLTNLKYDYAIPGTAQFSLGVQHELAPSTVAVVQYVGSTAWHQSDDRNINTLPLNDIADREAVATAGANANLYRIYPGFAGITQEETTTNASYHSLQAGIRMENRHGLTLQLAYTYSHEIDIGSNDLNGISNPFNIEYDRGSGALDRRHIFNANYIYNFPFFAHSQSALARSFLGGWQFSGVTVAQTGVPSNVTYSTDVIGLGGGTTNRPNLSGKMGYPKKQTAWFNTSAFTAPIAPWNGGGNQGFGNAGKDTIVGPGRLNFNLSLFKAVPLTSNETGPRFELRFESFNTFNHTQFSTIDTGFTSGTFGQVTATDDPRVLQLGAKFLF
jgi:hypothetical protein